MVVTKDLFWKPWFRVNFDPFVNNANLSAIAQNEPLPKFPLFTKNYLTQYKDFMARWLIKKILTLVTTVLRQALDVLLNTTTYT